MRIKIIAEKNLKLKIEKNSFSKKNQCKFKSISSKAATNITKTQSR